MTKQGIEHIVRETLYSTQSAKALWTVHEPQETKAASTGGRPFYVQFNDGSEVCIVKEPGDTEQVIQEKFRAELAKL